MSSAANMTQGDPLRHLARFSLPILFANAFQQLYTLSDSIIVGRLLGANAFAAVGSAGGVSWMVLSIILGIAQGFGARYAQCFGAGKGPALRKSIALSLLLGGFSAVCLTTFPLILFRPLLRALKTPPEILTDTAAYLAWLLGGTIVTIAYNIAASILRALGDSKSPLKAVILASIVNIALDLMLLGGLGMGVAGAAIATIAAQLFACFLCIYRLRAIPQATVRRSDFAWDGRAVKALLRMGAPLAFRNFIISIGGLAAQSVINGYGTLFVAGMAAARRYLGLMELAGGAMEGAMATYVGQNAGARQYGRIRDGMRIARRVSLVSSLLIAGIILVFARPLIAGMISGPPDKRISILQTGQRGLKAMAFYLPALYWLFIHRAALQGMGNACIPMLSGFVELAIRLACVLFLPQRLGVEAIFVSDGMGWIFAAVLLWIAYARLFKTISLS